MGYYYLIIIDAYSKWPEVHIVKNMTTETTIRACRQFFSTYGLPSVFVSDNGPQFTSCEFAKFLKMNGVVHKLSASYHPATNGQAERFIQTMKLKLKAIDCDRSQIHGELCSILMSYRKMIHPATGLSPSMMVYGRQIRSRIDLMIPSGNSNVCEALGRFRELELGTRVSAREYVHDNKWEFGIVQKRLGKLHYLILLDDGRVWKRHINQLRSIGQGIASSSTSEFSARGDRSEHVQDHTVAITPIEPTVSGTGSAQHNSDNIHDENVPLSSPNVTAKPATPCPIFNCTGIHCGGSC